MNESSHPSTDHGPNFQKRSFRLWGVLLCAGVCLATLGGVRAASRTLGYTGLLAVGQAPKLLSGTTGELTVKRPEGQTAFDVTFPSAFKAPPEVVLTVVGGGDTPVIARLTGPATPRGFRGVLTAPYFINRQNTANVTVNWIAVGE